MRGRERFALIGRTVVATSLVWVVGLGVYFAGQAARLQQTTVIDRGQPLLAGPPPPPSLSDGASPSVALLIPVAGIRADQLTDTFTQARDGGARPHDAIDIMAPAGTPVIAAAAGRVEELFLSAQGGNTIYVRTADGRWMHYYAHLQTYAPGLAAGQAVRAGQSLGSVGATGNADPAAPHLHFAVMAADAGVPWYRAGPAINPYPLLMVRR